MSASLVDDEAHDEDSVIGQPGVRVPEMRKKKKYLGNADDVTDEDRSSTDDLNAALAGNSAEPSQKALK